METAKPAEKNTYTGVSFKKNENRTVNDFIFDWRHIGFLNNGMSAYHRHPYTLSLDEMRKNSSETVEYATRNGANCVVLSSRLNKLGSNSHKIWLDIDKGHSRSFYEFSRGEHETSTEIKYKFLADVKVWYPVSILHVTKRGGKETFRETLTFQPVEFNKPVPEKVFTFAGLDLMEGHPVDVPEISDPKKQPTWRNGKLDFEYTATKQSADAYAKLTQQAETNQSPLALHSGPPVPDTPPPSDRWLYFAGAGVLVVMAGVFIVLARKSRKA